MSACVPRRLVLAWGCVGLWLGLQGAASRGAEETLEVPAPENITLDTRDGVVLRCTYYPGGFLQNIKTKQVTVVPGKEVVPIILLHGWDGKRNEYDFTAGMLQRLGHAVLVPDLRGHGESITRKVAGREFQFGRERMSRVEIESTLLDIDAAKKFLLEKNNAEELNIELLCVVGAEFGATLAVNWAVVDWSWPQLPGFKQGCDVKALVLLSPLNSFRGVTLNKSLQFPVVRNALSIMIVVGKDDGKNTRDAKAIYERLAKARGDAALKAKERATRQDLILSEPATSLSGTKLLTTRGLTVNQDLAGFVHLRLTTKKGDFPWRERRHPLVSP